MIDVVCCVLYIVYYMLYVVYSMLYDVYCVLTPSEGHPLRARTFDFFCVMYDVWLYIAISLLCYRLFGEFEYSEFDKLPERLDTVARILFFSYLVCCMALCVCVCVYVCVCVCVCVCGVYVRV